MLGSRRLIERVQHLVPTVAEFSILLYLLTLPFGPTFPQAVRHALIALIMISAVWLRLSPGIRSSGAVPFRLLLPMLVFLGSVVISVVYSVNPPMSLYYARFTPIAILFFLALQQTVLSVESVYRLCVAACCVILALSVDGLFQFAFGTSLLSGHGLWGSRVRGSIPHPNDLALIPILLPFLLILSTLKGRRVLKWLLSCIVPLAIATVVVSQSRAALFGMVTCLLVWSLIRQRLRLVLITLLFLGCVMLLAWLSNVGDFQTRLSSFTRLDQEGRIGIWLVAWQMFLDFPLGGLGAHLFGDLYLYYLAEIDLPQGYIPEIGFIPWAHSIYLELLCERGLVGFGAFALLVALLIRRLYVCLRTSENPAVRAIGVGLAGALGLFLMMGLVDLTFLKDWVSLVFWLIAALIARLPDLAGGVSTPATESPPDLRPRSSNRPQ